MKKCQACGIEVETAFCPECGAATEEIASSVSERVCPRCGSEAKSRFCGDCGFDMDSGMECGAVSPEPASTASQGKGKPKDKKSSKGKTAVIILLVIVVLVLAVALVFKPSTSGSIGESLEEATSGVSEPSENEGRELLAGKYVVGEDIPAGKYTFTYTTTLSDDDYWSLDYLWITNAGSEGESETLGGDKFDERYGSVSYEDAVQGKSFFVKLSRGDTLRVDSDKGKWTY